MYYYSPIVFLNFFLISISSGTSAEKDPFPIPKNLETDELLLALEAEVTRTIREELSATDDELQNLEGSGNYPVPTSTTTSTTTQKPTTTTQKPKIKKPVSPSKCIHDQECFKDAECPGGGKCFGSELGICDCNACVTNRKCENDGDCGGLNYACDKETGLCDCVKAFHTHGYNLFVKVLLTFCHQTKCTKSTNNCYGLPCRVGKCRCPSSSNPSSLPVHYFTTGK
ncbi:unnamed protein product [Caenorhabditis angaria]|uniref:Chondroitin proteoglycan 3 n=1 Tax=Caenorhabditis angaria TaxID=860376 RepID=A0A9P1IZ19_9PELO|nr:unnamed protein product [Caenorhabditis angaria]